MKDVEHTKVNEILAAKLKEVAVAPEWAQFAKTSHGKDRPPIRSDWWQIRAASILMSVEKLGPIGVSKLATRYGTRKNRGNKPEIQVKGATNHIRKILQQLESAELIKQEAAGVHKGRVITTKGTKLIIESVKEIKSKKE